MHLRSSPPSHSPRPPPRNIRTARRRARRAGRWTTWQGCMRSCSPPATPSPSTSTTRTTSRSRPPASPARRWWCAPPSARRWRSSPRPRTRSRATPRRRSPGPPSRSRSRPPPGSPGRSDSNRNLLPAAGERVQARMHTGPAHHHGPGGSAATRHWKPLAGALALTLGFMVVEVIGGLITGSLALLADAAHMLTDAGGLALSLLAIWFAARPATPQKTYGYLRMEILSAQANAVVLLVLSVFILYEAYERFVTPPEIRSGPMLAVAVVGLLVNLASMRL